MPVSPSLQQKVNRLRQQIDDLRYRYHVLNDPQVTDAMYGGLMDELRKLEEKYPNLITPDSPTQRVAGESLDRFIKIRHTVPQWSFNDAFTEEDLQDWQARILKILAKQSGHPPVDLDYVCELKIDGLHIVLTYDHGKLISAATRGDGQVGEDVTQNIKTILSMPLKLSEPVSLVVEGEVWLDRKHFIQLNQERKKSGEPLFANPRNAAAGTIRQLDPKIVAQRKLSLTAYDISAGDSPLTQAGELKRLKELGFKTDEHWLVCQTIKDIIEFHDEWGKKKDSQPYWLDGIVVKVNQKKYQDLLGYTGKAPRWAIAFKFPAEQGVTTIKDVYVQVGRTGALTPVALMEPVKLAGTTVTHATLHNFAEIKRLGVKIGDKVVVEKAGDIIPKVVRVLEKMRTGQEKAIKKPSQCPICGSAVKRQEIVDKKQGVSAALFCLNTNCYAQAQGRIIHFVSKKGFDIDGLGEKIIEQLLTQGLIKNAADLFTLTQGDLEPLDRFAAKSADNLVKAISSSKRISLARFVYGLGIRHVGEETALTLAIEFDSLDKLVGASVEELAAVNDVGPQVAHSIIEYFADKLNQRLIQELIGNGVIIELPAHGHKRQTGSLSGKTFVLTGSLNSLTRDQAKDKIREFGGEISSSVSKKTDYVVVGENPGSKYNQAKKLGVRVLFEQEFLKFIS